MNFPKYAEDPRWGKQQPIIFFVDYSPLIKLVRFGKNQAEIVNPRSKVGREIKNAYINLFNAKMNAALTVEANKRKDNIAHVYEWGGVSDVGSTAAMSEGAKQLIKRSGAFLDVNADFQPKNLGKKLFALGPVDRNRSRIQFYENSQQAHYDQRAHAIAAKTKIRKKGGKATQMKLARHHFKDQASALENTKTIFKRYDKISDRRLTAPPKSAYFGRILQVVPDKARTPGIGNEKNSRGFSGGISRRGDRPPDPTLGVNVGGYRFERYSVYGRNNNFFRSFDKFFSSFVTRGSTVVEPEVRRIFDSISEDVARKSINVMKVETERFSAVALYKSGIKATSRSRTAMIGSGVGAGGVVFLGENGEVLTQASFFNVPDNQWSREASEIHRKILAEAKKFTDEDRETLNRKPISTPHSAGVARPEVGTTRMNVKGSSGGSGSYEVAPAGQWSWSRR